MFTASMRSRFEEAMMRRCAVLCFVFVPYAWTVVCAAGPANAQAQLPAELQQKIDKAATEALTNTGVPSASVAVVKEGQIAYVHAYGNARLDPATPAKPEMPIASVRSASSSRRRRFSFCRSRASCRLTTRSGSFSRIWHARTKSASGKFFRTLRVIRTTGRRTT